MQLIVLVSSCTSRLLWLDFSAADCELKIKARDVAPVGNWTWKRHKQTSSRIKLFESSHLKTCLLSFNLGLQYHKPECKLWELVTSTFHVLQVVKGLRKPCTVARNERKWITPSFMVDRIPLSFTRRWQARSLILIFPCFTSTSEVTYWNTSLF